jgi:glycyl-tRNA synthetase beta chain
MRRSVVRAVAELKPTVDKFFDDIMVMTEDAQIRNARLGLLSELEQILVEVADFTKVQVDVA